MAGHEAGVDGQGEGGAWLGDFDGLRMAADVVAGLEEGEFVVPVEEAGGAHAGDAGADDGNA